MKVELISEEEVYLDRKNLDYKVHRVTVKDAVFDVMEWNRMYYNKFVRHPFSSIEKAFNSAKGYNGRI